MLMNGFAANCGHVSGTSQKSSEENPHHTLGAQIADRAKVRRSGHRGRGVSDSVVLADAGTAVGITAELERLCGTGPSPTVPCRDTGRPLRVATVEVSDRAVCPACAQLGAGGYVSFVADLRLAFACPSCRKLVWIAGA